MESTHLKFREAKKAAATFAMEPERDTDNKRSLVKFNKKAYSSFVDRLRTLTDAPGEDRSKLMEAHVRVSDVLHALTSVLKFDPNVPTYTADRNARVNERRARRVEEAGTTIYERYNKRSYERAKARKTPPCAAGLDHLKTGGHGEISTST
jgi:hypothetical protein